MKRQSILTMAMIILVSAFCVITWVGLPEAWAKGPGGKHVKTQGGTATTNAVNDIKIGNRSQFVQTGGVAARPQTVAYKPGRYIIR